MLSTLDGKEAQPKESLKNMGQTMRMKEEQLIQFMKNALGRLQNYAAAKLATEGGMLELDLQTGVCEFWPGRKMEVHPHPKLILGGSKKNPVPKVLQLWVAQSMMSNEDMSDQHVRERLLELLDDLVLDIRAKERVLPKMVSFACAPAGYIFVVPQAIYEELLGLGVHPSMLRLVPFMPAKGVH